MPTPIRAPFLENADRCSGFSSRNIPAIGKSGFANIASVLKDIRKLGQETLIYGMSTVIARLLNFLLTPFYTHYLIKDDYGVLAAVFAYIAFFNVVYQYGMDQAYMRFAVEDDGRSREEKFSCAAWSLLASSVLFSIGMFFWAGPLCSLGAVPGHEDLARYAAGILALDALSIVPFAELRLRHRAWTFAGIRAFNIALCLLLNVLFVAKFGLGIRGVFLATLLASAASFTLLAPVTATLLRPVMRWPLLKDLWRFGWPLVPAGLPSMAVQVIDRPILLRLTDQATVGLYQANFRLGVLMMMVVSMFDQAWRPFFLQRSKEPDSGPVLGRVLTYYLAGGFWLVLALSFFVPDIVRWEFHGRSLFHPSYWEGLGVVPIILSAYFVYGIYINCMASVTLSKRTDLLPWVTLLGAGVNVAANFAFIPYWNIMGAAWSALLAQCTMAAALFALGRRIYPIPYEKGRIAHLAAAAAIVLSCAYGGKVLCAGSPWAWLTLRAALLALFPILLLWTDFPLADERAALRTLRERFLPATKEPQ